jgi:hypothetical protein
VLAAVAFAAAISSAPLARVRSEPVPLQSTVCDLADHPERYASRLVEVRGKVTTTSVGVFLLLDLACFDTPVVLVIRRDAKPRSELYPLWRAVFREGGAQLGMMDKCISATVVGRFSILPKGYEFPTTLTPSVVKDLTVILHSHSCGHTWPLGDWRDVR